MNFKTMFTLLIVFNVLTNAKCLYTADSSDWNNLKKLKISEAVFFNDTSADSGVYRTIMYRVNILKFKEEINNPDSVLFKDTCNFITKNPPYGCVGYGGYLIINKKIKIYSSCGAFQSETVNTLFLDLKDFDLTISDNFIERKNAIILNIELSKAINNYLNKKGNLKSP